MWKMTPDLVESLPQLKFQHKELYWVQIEGKDYVFKPASWSELQTFRSMAIEEVGGPILPPLLPEAQDRLIHNVLVYPLLDTISNKDTTLEWFSRLLSAIFVATGFNAEAFNDRVQYYTEDENEVLNAQIIVTICSAFPSVTPDVIESWSFDKIIRHFSMAKMMLGGGDAPNPPQGKGKRRPPPAIDPQRATAQDARTVPIPAAPRSSKVLPGHPVEDFPAPPPPPNRGAVDTIDPDAENRALKQFMR